MCGLAQDSGSITGRGAGEEGLSLPSPTTPALPCFACPLVEVLYHGVLPADTGVGPSPSWVICLHLPGDDLSW